VVNVTFAPPIDPMAAHAYWKGFLKISLVSLPVKAYTASSEAGRGIQFNQLHDKCHSRIKHVKTCPIHGEVTSDEIVSGYEFAKDQYVIVDPQELEELRAAGDKSITIDNFIRPDQLDPLYESGRVYYLLPDGAVGQKPYALIHRAMQEEDYQAVGRVVLSGREQLVLLRPAGRLLAMAALRYASQLKQPSSFEDELTEEKASEQEAQLTRQLMAALASEEFDFSKYRDTHTEKLTEIIQAKVKGEELVAPPAEAQPQVINLMEALKASVEQIKPPSQKAAAKPPRKMAGSTKERGKKAATEKRKRSSG
jgi:DNA end-binding protein Ku